MSVRRKWAQLKCIAGFHCWILLSSDGPAPVQNGCLGHNEICWWCKKLKFVPMFTEEDKERLRKMYEEFKAKQKERQDEPKM